MIVGIGRCSSPKGDLGPRNADAVEHGIDAGPIGIGSALAGVGLALLFQQVVIDFLLAGFEERVDGPKAILVGLAGLLVRLFEFAERNLQRFDPPAIRGSLPGVVFGDDGGGGGFVNIFLLIDRFLAAGTDLAAGLRHLLLGLIGSLLPGRCDAALDGGAVLHQGAEPGQGRTLAVNQALAHRVMSVRESVAVHDGYSQSWRI